ncbi:lipopolysaccharide assembly protein LapA domain-containing protein [Pseudofrankia sp. DC12]|uniref:lipopolysaccharide assembly protein LapA domain-containing protein n=1 Tax=Pseudofrankia sp. DC12 TaxID=683315 RepID=UPI0005F764AB|nr:lipopolysaccharide assembly protein LapA domain-containing protein [Pseudofrankia sp. DC12]
MTAPGQPAGSYGYVNPAPGQIPPPTAPSGPTQVGPPGQPTGSQRRNHGGVSWVVYAVTVLILILAILVALFVAKNGQTVPIWLFGSRKYMSVAAALTIASGAGLVVGLLVGVIAQIPLRRRLRAAKRRLEG